jgi:hypothetical protein
MKGIFTMNIHAAIWKRETRCGHVSYHAVYDQPHGTQILSIHVDANPHISEIEQINAWVRLVMAPGAFGTWENPCTGERWTCIPAMLYPDEFMDIQRAQIAWNQQSRGLQCFAEVPADRIPSATNVVYPITD